MKTKHLLSTWITLVIALCTLQACDNDDERIRLLKDAGQGDMLTHQTSVSEINLSNTTSVTLRIAGGEAPYSAVSHDEGIARATVTNDNLHVEGIAVGTTDIIVSDSHREYTTLTVTVTQTRTTLDVVQTFAKIEGVDADAQPELYQEISRATLALSRYQPDMQLILNHEHSEALVQGTLQVHTTPEQGQFALVPNETEGVYEFHFDWGGHKDILRFFNPQPARSTGGNIYSLTLIQDLTEALHTLHPEYSQVTHAEVGIGLRYRNEASH